MRTTIWKYELSGGVNAVQMPLGAHPLHVAEQHGRIMLWARVDPDARPTTRTFRVIGTGHIIDGDPGEHVGSLLVNNGAFVFHVFDESA